MSLISRQDNYKGAAQWQSQTTTFEDLYESPK